MQLGNPIEPLHDALAAAIHRDLPGIKYETRNWDEYRKLTDKEKGEYMKSPDKFPQMTMEMTRRPLANDIEVVMYAQLWGSTALGYGGLGGAAMTPSYTVIIMSQRNYVCVYFGYGRLAYSIDFSKVTREEQFKFRNDMSKWALVECRDAPAKYGAVLPANGGY